MITKYNKWRQLMNNFDNVYCLGIECRKTANTEGDYCRGLEKGSGCIDNIIPSERPEHAALKDAVKGKGSVAACAEVRATLAGNKKYLVVIKTTKTEESEGGFEVYLFSLANGLYNKMGPFPTLDSALSRADCFGLFEAKMSKDEKTRIREAVGDYLYDDEDGLPVYDGGFEDFDGEGYDDFVGVDDDDDPTRPEEPEDGWDGIEQASAAAEKEYADYTDDMEREIADTMPVFKKGLLGGDSDYYTDDYLDAPNMFDPERGDNATLNPQNNGFTDGDPFEESKTQLFDKLLNE